MGGTSCKTDIKDKDYQKIHKVTRVLSDQYHYYYKYFLSLSYNTLQQHCTSAWVILHSHLHLRELSSDSGQEVLEFPSFSTNRKVGNDGNKLDCLGLTLFMASHDSITNFTNIFGNFLFAVSAGWRVAGAFKNHSSHRKLHWNPLSA